MIILVSRFSFFFFLEKITDNDTTKRKSVPELIEE
jgi:hypothetical protein